jgi:NAD(P)-dependent dehydrogenase (short-subunit alcohol dehydrogenase family)
MKIAITGGTAGIGQALGNLYEQDGHEVVRLSRRTGHNIRVTPKTADAIESCDVFINNAQVGFAQTELLFEMSRRWKGTGKRIISIGTMMTMEPTCTMQGMSEYYVQKTALDAAVRELRAQRLGIYFVMVRPGNIATSADKTVPPATDLTEWSQCVYNILEHSGNIIVPEINIG